MSRRPLESQGSSGGEPALKKSRPEEAPRFKPQTAEDLSINVLEFQNKKLSQRLITRLKLEEDLRRRIEASEKKQTSAEAIVYVISRYWNQLNEDIRILLQRFDAETSDESESNNESHETTSFLTQLANFDSEEMSEQLQQRVDSSTRAIEKIVQSFDRIVQRNLKISTALKSDDGSSLEEAVKQANIELTTENKNLNILVTSLHEKYRTLNLQFSEVNDRVESVELANDDLKNRIDEVEFELNTLRNRHHTLEQDLQRSKERVQVLESQSSSNEGGNNASTSSSPDESSNQGRKGSFVKDSMTQGKIEELQRDLEEQRELATTRFAELETLNNDHKEALKKIEELKMELKCLPEERVVETAEYKCLQSHFSVLYNESMQLKTQLEDARTQLQTSKNNHLRQIEHMESEELSMQKRLRTEVIQLEDNLSQVRREYEMLHLEYKQMLAANEQTGPINREMRNLITSLQGHNSQLKTEVQRLKKKLKESMHEIQKLKHEKDVAGNHGNAHSAQVKAPPSDSKPVTENACSDLKTSPVKVETVKDEDSSSDIKTPIKKESGDEAPPTTIDPREKAFNDMKTQHRELKTKHETLKSMYETSQNKIKDLKKQLAALSSKIAGQSESSGSSAAPPAAGDRKLPSDEQINKLKDKIRILEKALANQKQVHQQQEEALLNEMEVTGSAFESMQEMNLRLVQQLREKDDANFKLMSERIKSQQIQKLLKEEKESLTEQVIALQSQVEAQNQVVRKLEEKERLLQNNLSTIEKEVAFKQQAMELHKRKAIESAQSAADLKLHLDKYMLQLKEAQGLVADKTKSLQEAMFKKTRLQEEVISFKRKYERAKKFELATTADEVLQEECRGYKAQLTCPSCQARRKDAVLTKCFHVFCYECLKTRYDTRQRKCPKCQMAFGANDYHKLYLG